MRSPFCSVFSFWKRCLRPFPSSVSSCTTSELITSPSQDLTESDHIFSSGMGLFAFSLTVWACLWSSVFHYNYFIYICLLCFTLFFFCKKAVEKITEIVNSSERYGYDSLLLTFDSTSTSHLIRSIQPFPCVDIKQVEKHICMDGGRCS